MGEDNQILVNAVHDNSSEFSRDLERAPEIEEFKLNHKRRDNQRNLRPQSQQNIHRFDLSEILEESPKIVPVPIRFLQDYDLNSKLEQLSAN